MDLVKVTPRHQKFIDAIAESPIHIIATMRGKDQYETTKDEKTGKLNVQKLGVGAKQRDGFEYEFTCTFLIDQKTNTSEPQKDNSHIFEGQGAILLTEKHGEQLIKWANSGEEPAFNITRAQQEIIELATALGGSKNEKVKEATIDILGVANPKACNDESKLKASLAKLKEIKGE